MGKVKYLLYIFFTTFCIVELGLRSVGFKPGIYNYSEDFKVVDKLKVFKDFYTDDYGIYKFSTWVSDSLPKYTEKKTGLILDKKVGSNLADIDNIKYAYSSFARLQEPNNYSDKKWQNKFISYKEELNGAFAQKYSEIIFKKDKNKLDKAILDYVSKPFNDDGFRSISYNYNYRNKYKTLIIGDSFVYGFTARPFYNSFYDLLLARNNFVFAAGIPGTDPAQYNAIAKKYIPKINPELVIVCFYEGNDYMTFTRDPLQDEPIEHLTNGGFFYSNPKGVYLNPNNAYQYYLNLFSIPKEESIFNYLMSKTVLSSLTWGVLYKISLVNHSENSVYKSLKNSITVSQRINITKKYIKHINESALCSNTNVIYVIIPDRDKVPFDNNELVTIDTIKANLLFEDIPYYYPTNLNKKDDYALKDYHFSNNGSIKFANFIDSIIEFNSEKYISTKE